MYRLLVVCSSILSLTISLSDVDKKCFENNSELLSNDLLLGSWFKIYRFAPGGRFPSLCYCTEVKYTKPLVNDIEEYKKKYNATDLPYSLDDNPIIQDDGRWVGMVTGDHRAKFYVLSPKNKARITAGYSVITFKLLSDKYLMTTPCALRGNFRWLLSRDKNSSVEELEEIIKKTPELKLSDGQRFCVISKYPC